MTTSETIPVSTGSVMIPKMTLLGAEVGLPADAPLTAADMETAMGKIYERGDRIVGWFLCVHAMIAFALAFFYETWLPTVVVSTCAVAMFLISARLLPRSVITRYLAGLSLQAFVALHIYQLHGLAEMHFFFFTGFTVMIVYQDWKCFWPGAVAIIGQHLIFAIVHNSGVDVNFYEQGYVSFSKLAFHFSIALGQVGICGYWAHLLKRQTISQAWQQRHLESANRRLRSEMGDRLAAEEARRDAEAQYRRVADNLPGTVYQLVRERDGHHRFGFISEGCREMFGLEPQEIMDDPVTVFHCLHPEDRQSLSAALQESARLLEPLHWEGHSLREEGEIKSLQIRARPAPQPDGSIVWDGVIVDVSELRKTAAEARAAKEEAESANQAKSEFLSRMSHELRTPLNSILGFGQLLARGSLTEKQIGNVDFILSSGRHLLNLVNEVLDISRIETGNLTLSMEPIGVQTLVEEVLALMRPLAAQRAIVLHPPGAGSSDFHVRADLQRLKQVLLNILSNAVKYNRDGGEVAITCVPFARAVPGEEGRVSTWLRLEVKDSGYGMRAEDLQRLFTPFDRLGAESRAIEGTGIGLALSKRLMEAMGGQIGVRTVLDEGSTFSIELPITAAPARTRNALQREANAQAGTPPSRKWRILCIEDNLANREVIEGIFAERPDIELLSATQGRLGLELAREHLPDLILLDAHLPDLPGAEVLVRLQAEAATRKIPVILISADATPRQIARLRSLGARDYVTKPFEIDVLFEVIDRNLNSVGTAKNAGMALA